MHGVRLVNTPPAKTHGSALSGLPDRLGSTELRSTMMKGMSRDKFLILAAIATAGLAALAAVAGAQTGHVHPQPAQPSTDSARVAGMADRAMSGPMDDNMMKHMELTPVRAATRNDSTRARKLAAELKAAIAKYQDTAAAVADGYKMFLPNVKEQHVY